MSHFTKVETKITELLFLKKAIADMDLAYQEGDLKAKGWLWKKAKADLLIPTKSGYDIGFKFNGSSYDVVADWDSINDVSQDTFINELNQRYAYNVVSDTMAQQGFTIAEEKTEDGTIKMTMRKAS
ncbi:MAG: DUF1257 domain-containing protein [Deltaproteobacteria bacterium]|nr:DUF1257 domain-containing protein [Candidatus Anaeroferrophillus wilburensis]MBN2887849.1 DUF1257 domain-containing protein [Deltaproteobacteria bacterium]